ncbi:hypothetical protein AX14_000449 [Amanita brunnescens Koide BX004]|nr:hypothetical protein AX14_000449 [Amanita brunnescens Koide BX004]
MRAFHFLGVFFLFCAFILTLITSVSLPYLRTLDIARTHFGELQVTIDQDPTDQLRLGVWSYCHYLLNNGDRRCTSIGYAYSVLITDVATKSNISIHPSWTRGLAVHPVSAVVTIAALVVSFVPNVSTLLIATLLSFISMMLCFLAFLIDIALYAYLKYRIGNHANGLVTLTGPGLWVNFVAMILTGLAVCSLFIRRRRQIRRDEGVVPATSITEKPFFSRFRKDKG